MIYILQTVNIYLSHMNNNTEVVNKSRYAIQITGNPSLLQRKSWNVLLFHAFNDLKSKETHEITLDKLSDKAGYDSKDLSYFKKIISGLVSSTVEWDFLKKDGKYKWGISSLLSSVCIEDGTISYSYSPFLREQLSNPSIYAKLDLEIQSRFSSKYALTLWEMCCDYKKVDSTGWIELEKFKIILGSTSKAYNSFPLFNQHVLKPAILEVNEKSELHVTAEFERFKRRVAKVRLLITEKEVATAEKTPSSNEKPYNHIYFKRPPNKDCKVCSGSGWVIDDLNRNLSKICQCAN